MKRRTLTVGLAIAIGLISLSAASFAAFQVTGQKSVSFRAVGPGGLAIVGNGADLRLVEKGQALQVIVGLGDLKTGIDLRDRHMKEKYLETAKFPTASLEVERKKLVAPSNGADVDGQVTIHGVTKPIRFHYSAFGSPRQAHVEGSFQVNMRDFGITVPSYLGITVRPNVQVSAKFDVIDK